MNLGFRFRIHQMNTRQIELSRILRETVIALAVQLDATLEDCDEKTIAMQKLEESLMWANKGLALGHDQ